MRPHRRPRRLHDISPEAFAAALAGIRVWLEAKLERSRVDEAVKLI